MTLMEQVTMKKLKDDNKKLYVQLVATRVLLVIAVSFAIGISI